MCVRDRKLYTHICKHFILLESNEKSQNTVHTHTLMMHTNYKQAHLLINLCTIPKLRKSTDHMCRIQMHTKVNTYTLAQIQSHVSAYTRKGEG